MQRKKMSEPEYFTKLFREVPERLIRILRKKSESLVITIPIKDSESHFITSYFQNRQFIMSSFSIDDSGNH